MGLHREEKEGDECRVDGVGPRVKECGTEMTAGWLPTEGKKTVLGIPLHFYLTSYIPVAST